MHDEQKELRAEYLQDIKNRLNRFEDDIKTKNIYGVMTFIHRTKGSGATFGFGEFTQIAAEMENILKDIDWEKLSKHYENLAASLSKNIEHNNAEKNPRS